MNNDEWSLDKNIINVVTSEDKFCTARTVTLLDRSLGDARGTTKVTRFNNLAMTFENLK